jgi:hypothetical protein
MLGLVCAYCAHKLVEGVTHCLHCGAPAHAKEADREPPQAKPSTPTVVVVPSKLEALQDESQKSDSSWLYWLVIVLLGVMAAVVLIVFWRYMMAGPAPATDPVAALPDQLRSAATCTTQGPVQTVCVVAAADPILRDGVSGGRDLTFTATLVPPNQLEAIVAQWRRQGGKVIAAGTVFVDVSPSGGVRYANTATRLRIETVTFTSEMSAQTFVMRAGLARQPL